MLENYTVIDLEMTGLSAKRDSVLEVGAVRVRSKKIQDTYTSLVYTSKPLPEKITELTGITDEMVTSGRDCCEVMRELLAFIGKDVLVGHNVIFDYGFIKQWALNNDYEIDCMAVDTLKLARKFLPENQKKNLESLCTCFHIPRQNAHRALEDATETCLLFEKMKELYGTDREAEDFFTPKPLSYKAKKQAPATEHQKEYLKRYAAHFHLELPKHLSSMTRSDVSRQIDRWIREHGRLPTRSSDSSW